MGSSADAYLLRRTGTGIAAIEGRVIDISCGRPTQHRGVGQATDRCTGDRYQADADGAGELPDLLQRSGAHGDTAHGFRGGLEIRHRIELLRIRPGAGIRCILQRATIHRQAGALAQRGDLSRRAANTGFGLALDEIDRHQPGYTRVAAGRHGGGHGLDDVAVIGHHAHIALRYQARTAVDQSAAPGLQQVGRHPCRHTGGTGGGAGNGAGQNAGIGYRRDFQVVQRPSRAVLATRKVRLDIVGDAVDRRGHTDTRGTTQADATGQGFYGRAIACRYRQATGGAGAVRHRGMGDSVDVVAGIGQRHTRGATTRAADGEGLDAGLGQCVDNDAGVAARQRQAAVGNAGATLLVDGADRNRCTYSRGACALDVTGQGFDIHVAADDLYDHTTAAGDGDIVQ